MRLNPFKKRFERRLLPERIERYAREVLPTRLGTPARTLRLAPVPSRGKNTFLRLLTAEQGAAYLLRIYPFSAEKRKGAEHTHVARLLRDHGITVPHILFTDESALTLTQFGFEAVVEEWIDGRKPKDADIATTGFTSALAQTLARIHEIKSDVAGKPWRALNERREPISYYRERSRLYVQRIAQHVSHARHDELSRCEAFLEHEITHVRPICEFCFIHGDVQRGNLLVAPDGTLVIVDFGTCGYGYFEEDLVSARFGVFASNDTAFETFVESYFSRAGKEARTRYDETEHFFRAFFHLEKASSAATRVRKVKEGKTGKSDELAAFGQKALTNWESLLRIVKSEL